MNNLNDKLYQEIVEQIINVEGINKFDARNTLANILENYFVAKVENDPEKYDLKRNITRYLSDKKRQGLSPHTISTYTMQLNIFSNSVTKKVQEITKADIISFLESREDKAPQRSSLETIRAILRSFFEWLRDEDIIDEDPMIKIHPYKLGKPMPKALTIDELELVRDNCTTLREKALVETLYSTGCRLAEVEQIDIGNIDWNNKSVKVIGKGNKERTVFFSAKAIINIRKYLASRSDSCPALFTTSRKPIRRMGRRSIQREVAKLGDKANLHKKIHPHVFRHTMATLMLNNGCPIPVVQELLGHDDMATTQIYAKVTEDYKYRSYERFIHN